GCAGCAAGQIGQNGPGEVTVSTGNRNFAGKQGKGEVYLASPATVAASAIAGVITTVADIPARPIVFEKPKAAAMPAEEKEVTAPATTKETMQPTTVEGRVWIIPIDNIDTDMIYHNRYLSITDRAQMGQYAFSNLKGWENFARNAKRGDIIVTGENFGAGSSRQQAVDCFLSLGISVIVAKSFGAIYERNAINAAMPILTADLLKEGLKDGDIVRVNFSTGKIELAEQNKTVQAAPFSDIQMQIYQRGGLLAK
ncbi:MAG: aconitase family protein, partial [bacterium]